MDRYYNRQYNRYGSIYSNSSVAHKIIKNDETYSIKQLKKQQEEKKKQKEVEREKQVLYINSKLRAKDRLNGALLSFVVSVIAICGFFLLSNNDRKTNLQNEISNQSNIIKANAEEIKNLEIELAHSYDIKNIEQLAKKDLNMALPTPSQIYYIELPKADYVTYANNTVPEKTGFNLIIDKIGKVIN